MLPRVFLFLVAFSILFYGFYWVIFRTDFINAERLLELAKRVLLTGAAIFSAVAVLVAFYLADHIN